MATSALSHLLLLLFLVLVPISAIAQTSSSRISLGQSLSTDGSASLVSPSGDFAFGFRRLEDGDLFLLAIWFDKIPDKTIVWSANGNTPVPRGSKVELTADGQLVLTNHQDQEIWRAGNINGTVAYATISNTGNLELTSTDSAVRWQSFDHPTDTLLPMQVMGLSGTLASRETKTNYSEGRFEFRMQSDGNLVLYTVDRFSRRSYFPYWASNTVGNGSQLVFNQTGYIYLSLKNGNVFNLTSVNMVSVPTGGFYQRATLDFDGVFRQYTHPKTPSSDGSWEQKWSIGQFVPRDICMAIRADEGDGACGFNSYCMLEGEFQMPSCKCPPGYAFMDQNNTFKGCKQDFISQSCEMEGSRADPKYDMIEMINTDWPLSDFEHYQSINENQCRDACLVDCLCAVAIFRGGECWKKKLPLSNGRMNPNVGGKALIKMARGNSTSPPLPLPDSGKGKKDNRTPIVIISAILGSSAFLNFFLISLILWIIFFTNHKKVVKLLQSDSSVIGVHLRSFTYMELEKITDGFKEELGMGSCGTVYKGLLVTDHANCVAVKRLDKVVKEAEKEFKTEVSAIGRIHHKNLVQLFGFCDEGPHRLLVYEYMSNGSLASYLFGSSRPSWNQRTHIAFGIARGLTYLHEECGNQIIHCDIKPQNILLDDSFTARISDFGLAKLLTTNQTRTTTNIRGTRGYVAPEWFKNMAITAKVDVYSFGVMLLEIVCCRMNVLPNLEDGDAILTDWVCDCYKEGRIDKVVENDEEAMNDARKLERMVMVAIWCIQEDPSLRPSMKKVTQMLEGAVEVAVPPDPFSFISSLA